MNFLARGLALFGLSLLATSVFAQSEPDIAILKVNGQEVFQSDLELVKSMLPLERYKTTKARTNLIEGIYLEFLIQKTVLEQKGMQRVTPERVQSTQANWVDWYGENRSKDYTPEGLTARKMLELAYRNATQENRFADILESYTNTKAALERQITVSYLDSSRVPEVKARAMLLQSVNLANRLEKQIRSGADFARLAERYSLVRALVGGSYPGTEHPEFVRFNFFEPEVQVGIAKFAKKGMIRVNAPFGRAWLINILDVSRLKVSLINKVQITEQQLLWAGRTIEWAGSNLGDGSQLAGIPEQKPVIEILDVGLTRYNPIAVHLNNLELGISSIYAHLLFRNDPGIFAQMEASMNQEITAWLRRGVIRIGLPQSGAGDVNGLASYLAARVNVSENQLKSYYTANRKQFLFESSRQEMPCRFDTWTFANQMRNMFTLFTDDRWFFTLESPFNGHCDVRGGGKVPPLPEKPSRTSLTPVPGGFVSKVFKYQNEFWFIVLYEYQPKPLLKPFVLVRNEVEQEYRGLVAKKQLPAFEQALRKRTNPQNLLKQAMRELENAGK
jgi:hypothetical protein